MKIQFNSSDDLPLNKQIKIHTVTVVIINIFEKDNKLHPAIFLDECLYQV